MLVNYVVRSATDADIDEAASTLAAAFASYPWTRWCLPEAEYDSRLLSLQSIYLSHALQHGMVLVTPTCDGVAALLPPDAPEPSESVQLEIAEIMGDRVQEVFGLVLPSRLDMSWDFATLGVRPESAGRGLGSALIKEALLRVSESDHRRVSLETSAESNVSLYERHGFKVSHRSEVPGGPVVYTMGMEL